MKEIVYHKAARKMLDRIPANEARRIRSKLQQYAVDPASQANNVKRLQGRPGFRLRIGDWRVIFCESERVLDILDIGQRGGIYD